MNFALLLVATVASAQAPGFDAVGKTIPELQDAMARGDVTSVELVRQYLARIDAFDDSGPKLNAMLYVSPTALEDAAALDGERRASGARGPLHGIPIILKDNYDTRDMPTTAGSIALAGHVPPNDGYQVGKLREAGVVILGKANMHELAFGITTVSSLGGQTLNPYEPSRTPGGSSGGTGAAIAAELAAIGMGSDTCGSIRIPAANNNLFGLRVTQGLSSRDGIVPLALTQDVGGPIARSVIDLALVLDATVGFDPADPQTAQAAGHVPESYTATLNDDALAGVRLGLLRPFLVEDGAAAPVTRVVLGAAERMAEHGAELVDLDIDVAEFESATRGGSVIRMELKPNLRDYLTAGGAPVRSLEEILTSGLYHESMTERFRSANEMPENAPEYRERIAQRSETRRKILRLFEDHDLDAVVYPTLRELPARIGEPQRGSACSLAAHSGLPAFSLPAGFTGEGVPVGIELLGKPFGESELLAIGYAYERRVSPRRLPDRTPSLISGSLSRSFRLVHETIRGSARFDVPTQTLHYELANVLDDELIDIKLARGSDGPILASMGSTRHGSIEIDNAAARDVVSADVELWVFAHEAPNVPLRVSLAASN